MKPHQFEQHLLALGYQRRPPRENHKGPNRISTEHDWIAPRRVPGCRRNRHEGYVARYWRGVRTLKCRFCSHSYNR